MIVTLLIIIFIHWFADFVLQTDWQARNKSTNNHALFLHVAIYSIVWALVAVIYGAYTNNLYMLLFAPITFVCHFTTDYFTSRLNTKLLKAGKTHEFFVSIGFDQFLHYTQLFLTYKLLT